MRLWMKVHVGVADKSLSSEKNRFRQLCDKTARTSLVKGEICVRPIVLSLHAGAGQPTQAPPGTAAPHRPPGYGPGQQARLAHPLWLDENLARSHRRSQSQITRAHPHVTFSCCVLMAG